MKTAIMQPYFMPYIGYFQLINIVDRFIILDDVNFIKKGWIHRNRIPVNNRDFLFTIPLKKASQNLLITDISIAQDTNWEVDFLKTIKLNYRKSPYFSKVFPLIESIVSFEDINLSKFVVNSIKEILKFLNIDTEIVETSSVFEEFTNKGENRIISICKKNNSDSYYNLIGGKDLYSKQKFEEYDLKLHFISNTFENTNSIIDILMKHSIDESKHLLNKFTES